MKTKVFAVAAALMMGMSAFAQAPQQKGSNTQMMVENMTKQLNLKPDQQKKLTDALNETSKKMDDLRAKKMDQAKKMEEMKVLRKEQNDKIKSILTEEQYKKWEETKANMPQSPMKKGEGQHKDKK